MKWLLMALFSLAAAARGQSEFHVYSGTENLVEGGLVDKLTVVTGGYQFNIRPPKNWYRQVEESSHRIVFSSPSGKSALTVQFLTNSPGMLPDKDYLRAQVLREHAGASVMQYAVCPTAYRPGVFFDLVSMPFPHVQQKMRHGFVAEPAGHVEFILTASDDEFEKDNYIFMGVARAFRVDRLPAK